MKKILALFVVAAFVFVTAYASSALTEPDVIYYNAKISTLDAKDSAAEAVAIKDGKFLKVGGSDEVKKLAGPSTKMVDLGGKTVVPGFIDTHCHAMETMMIKENWVDCRYPGCPSVKEALARIAERAKTTPKGAWIFAAGVSASENKFAEKRLPTRAELDKAAPDNPALLANGAHMDVVNSMALDVLGIRKGVDTLAHGGSAILDKDGEPTGILTDAQANLPITPSVADLEKYYTKDIQEFWNQYGFTSLLAITSDKALPVLQKLAESGYKPTIRYAISVWTSSTAADMPEDLSKFKMPATADPAWYRFFAIKGWVDGENDCRAGYMHEPYLGHFDIDSPGGKGSQLMTQAGTDRLADIANKAGVACMTHCTGDAAMDIGLNAYEHVIKSGRPKTLMRIEHFGVFQMSDEQLKRAKDMRKDGLYISIQPTWLLDLVKADYENMGKERTESGFRFRSMIDAGLEPPAGTDMTGVYLANIDPFLAIYAVVTRNSDAGIFLPEQAVSVTEALKMWTIWSAKALGESDVKGSVEPGKYADMVVLSDDIFTMPKEQLKDVKVLKTIVGGAIVYESK